MAAMNTKKEDESIQETKFISFSDLESDFYHYLTTEGGLAKKTCGDYISRLRFLATYHQLDNQISKEYIDLILATEEVNRRTRTRYKTPHAIMDFHAGLMKFLSFIESGYCKKQNAVEKQQIEIVETDSTLSTTEKENIVKARIGQGLFRSRLFDYWKGCAVTNCNIPWFLVASHIKPWKDANNEERTDPYNGLLLTPNFDKLFDKGYISFDIDGKIIFSHLLSSAAKQALNLSKDMHLRNVSHQHEKYLLYHQEHCLLY